MKEIKFRVWKKHLKEMRYDLSQFYIGDFGKKGFIFMQYINLKDKNNKEIYEGDILESSKDDYLRSVIEYCNVKFALGKSSLSERIINHYELKIIGNIYENPELIKK
jgi:hypothetical protein